jgi:hypothetical protein
MKMTLSSMDRMGATTSRDKQASPRYSMTAQKNQRDFLIGRRKTMWRGKLEQKTSQIPGPVEIVRPLEISLYRRGSDQEQIFINSDLGLTSA